MCCQRSIIVYCYVQFVRLIPFKGLSLTTALFDFSFKVCYRGCLILNTKRKRGTNVKGLHQDLDQGPGLDLGLAVCSVENEQSVARIHRAVIPTMTTTTIVVTSLRTVRTSQSTCRLSVARVMTNHPSDVANGGRHHRHVVAHDRDRHRGVTLQNDLRHAKVCNGSLLSKIVSDLRKATRRAKRHGVTIDRHETVTLASEVAIIGKARRALERLKGMARAATLKGNGVAFLLIFLL